MNISASGCNSGGESGWTSYLDQSSLSANQYQRDGGIADEDYRRKGTKQDDGGEEEEEEDLSMVSDASSRPSRFNEDEECFGDDGCSYSTPTRSKLEKKIKKHGGKQQHHPHTDDTASSPVLGFNKKSLAIADDRVPMQHVLRQGFSGTQFKGKSSSQGHFGLFQSISEMPSSKKPGKF